MLIDYGLPTFTGYLLLPPLEGVNWGLILEPPGFEPPYSLTSVLSVSFQPSVDQSQCNSFSSSDFPCILWFLLPEKLTQIWQLVLWSWNPWKDCSIPGLQLGFSCLGTDLCCCIPSSLSKKPALFGNSLLSREPKAQGPHVFAYACVGQCFITRC